MADKSYEIEIKTTTDTSGITSIKDELTATKQEAEDLGQTASNSMNELSQSSQDASESISETAQFQNELNASVSDMDSSSMDAVTSSAEDMASSTENASSSSEQLGISISNIDPSVIEQLADAMQQYGDSADEGADATEDLLEGLTSGALATGFASTFMGLANSAGDYQDSMLRMGLALSGHAMTVEEVSQQYGASVSKMAEQTGRGGGSIRNHFSNMAVAGVKSTDILESSFQAVANGSFYSGESIESLSNKFQRISMTGMLSAKQLSSLGLTMDDLAKVMGVSADEVSEKFKSMTAEQRASIMSQASATKYGTEVNDVFKNSWEGLWTQLDKGKAGLERLVGDLILPYLIPAVETSIQFVQMLTDTFKTLPQPVKDVMGGALLLVGSLATVGLGLNAVMKLANTIIAPFKSIAKVFGIDIDKEAKKLADTLKSKLSGAFDSLKTKVSSVATTIKTNLVGAFRSVSKFMKTQLIPALKNAGLRMLELGRNALTSGLNALRSGAMWLINKARIVATTVANWGATASQWALNVAMSMNPITIVVLAILGLIAVLGYLYFNNEQVRGAIDGLGQSLMQIGQIIYTAVVGAFDWLMATLQNVWNYIITLGGLLPANVNITGNQILDTIIRVLTFIATLPVQLAMIFINMIASVLGFGNNFVQNMLRAGINAVTNFANQIRQLPSKLSTELNNMLSLVGQWASTLPQKFWDAGVQAVQNFLNALGIHSPGTMQTMLLWEISEMGNRIPSESRNLLGNIGKLGTDIVDEFGNPSLEYDINGTANTSINTNDSNGSAGNTINLTIEVGSVDNESRVQEIVDAVRRELSWNNTTAGRTI